MSNLSVVEVLHKFLSGELAPSHTEYPLEEGELIIGTIESPYLRQLLSAIEYLDETDPVIPADHAVLAGIQGISYLVSSEVQKQFGREIASLKNLGVRYHNGEWVATRLSTTPPPRRKPLMQLVGSTESTSTEG